MHRMNLQTLLSLLKSFQQSVNLLFSNVIMLNVQNKSSSSVRRFHSTHTIYWRLRVLINNDQAILFCTPKVIKFARKKLFSVDFFLYILCRHGSVDEEFEGS